MKKHNLFIITAGAVILLISVVPQFLSTYYIGLLTLILIFALFAMSLDLLVGYIGLPSLGHAAFFGMGSYCAGIMSVKIADNFGITLASGLVAAAVGAAIFGLVALRAKSHYFLIITIAIAQMLWAVAFKWTALTGGSDGFSGISRPSLGIIPWDLTSVINYYYLVLIFFVIATALLYFIVNSPFGHILQGIRESEQRMTSLGYNVWLYKYLAFIIAGFFAGLAGIFHVYYNGYVGPNELGIVMSTEVMLMVILGGAGTLFGPAVGAAVIVLVSNLVSSYTERWILILGLMYVLVVLFAPQGIYNPIKRYVKRWLPI
jgi:branched-chain amino acid transport system permease protein